MSDRRGPLAARASQSRDGASERAGSGGDTRMAVVDQRWSDGPVRSAPPASFDRQPPQDLAAEQSVLGGMLMSKDAVADVLEALTSADFYKPAHALIFDAILDLYSRGEPADTVTVAAELDKSGSLGRVGGAVYLHTLMATVPTAANAAFYAQIVAEKAILRRLVEAGTRIVQLGYGGNDGEMGGGEVDEIVDRAQAEIYDVTERRTSEDYVVLEELLQPTMDEIDAIAAQGGRSMGVPTGFADLDNLTNGLHPGQMIIVAARPGIGKALAMDTPLVTPTGWTTMGRVAVGDELIGADGRPTRVVAATEVLLGRPCFEVEFSDGEVIVADAEHQWSTWDARARARIEERFGSRVGWPVAVRTPQPSGPVSRTTAELARSVYHGSLLNHAIPTCAPLAVGESELPLDPWVLGFLLGSADDEVRGGVPEFVGCDTADREWVMKEFDRLGCQVRVSSRPDRFRVLGLADVWLELGLHRRTRIPSGYLRASIEQRASLVQGLMDRAGDVDRHGRYRWGSTNIELACGVRELLSVQGCATTMHRRYLSHEGHPQPPVWEIAVRSRRGLARLPRKVCSAGAERAGAVRPGRQRRPPLPGRAGHGPHPQFDSRVGRGPARLCQAPSDGGDLLPGDEQERDHHAVAVGGGRDPADAHAGRDDERAGLAEDRPPDVGDLRRAAVHRRLAEHDDDGDPGEGAPAQAAPRPEADRGRLPAADDVREAGGVAAAGGQ